MSEDLYSDYIRREPHPRNVVFIRKWHRKLFKLSLKNKSVGRVLEIGPGHGFFAEHVVAHGIDYEFIDTSPAVCNKMIALGFNGHFGLLSDLLPIIGKFDLVYMSHVLEHSPSWVEARQLLQDGHGVLNVGGSVVIVSPDILNWRHEFWNVDWSHGYPTSIRNVAQLCSDVGFNEIVTKHHRNGSTGILTRAIFCILSKVPHRAIDRVITPTRYLKGDGLTYSWKAVFGWRQIYVSAKKNN